MSRLFTFGCSFTQYTWPTWANMLGIEYDEFYNWGLSGIGNRAIAERVAEAHAKHQFTKDDVVIVQWSSHLRNDWYHKYSFPDRGYGWKTCGSVFSYINEKLYDQNWIQTFFYEPAYVMHTLNNVVLVQSLLNSIGCTWYMTSIGDLRNIGADTRDDISYGEKGNITTPNDKFTDQVLWQKLPELEIYNDVIWNQHANHWLMPIDIFVQKFDNSYSYTYRDDTFFGKKTYAVDLHPTPKQHLMWIKHELLDKLDISHETLELSEQISNYVDKLYEKYKNSKEAFTIKLLDRAILSITDKLKWPPYTHGF